MHLGRVEPWPLLGVVLMLGAIVYGQNAPVTPAPPAKTATTPSSPPAAATQPSRPAAGPAAPPIYQPSSYHRRLEPLVGEFECVSNYIPGIVGQKRETRGTITRRWALNQLFLVEEQDNAIATRTYTGLALIGYDIRNKMYVGAWADTLDSSLDYMTGELSSDEKAITFTRVYEVPDTQEMRKIKYIIRMLDADRHTIELNDVLPDGTVMRILESTCTRKPRADTGDAAKPISPPSPPSPPPPSSPASGPAAPK